MRLLIAVTEFYQNINIYIITVDCTTLTHKQKQQLVENIILTALKHAIIIQRTTLNTAKPAKYNQHKHSKMKS
jgi:hypothetical protein